ncbi:hypothetical protein ASF36_13870 [Methylobacterium sp. Leaf90]|nr:hypothetical protein ASF36_13870 [Methylobacterium sp. Leaf90]
MPRWLYVVICLVLFTAVMLALRAVLHATVPGAVEWASSKIGAEALLGTFLILMAIGGVWSYLEHRRQASARRR